jgi:hypothetical protein
MPNLINICYPELSMCENTDGHGPCSCEKHLKVDAAKDPVAAFQHVRMHSDKPDTFLGREE